jgi:hypothetical protein
MALEPDQSLMARYIAVKTDAGWVVRFGKVEGGAFKVAYEARPGVGIYQAEALSPTRPETGFTLAAARAIDRTAGVLRGSRPYNAAALPAADGIYVYAYPAPLRGEEFPLGADFRWLVSPDGTRVLEQRRMHIEVISAADRPPNARFRSHTHLLREEVEDTDSMHAIQTRFPQRILMPSGAVATVDPDGNITWYSRDEARAKLGE